jgi:hypothetical protein
MLSRAVGGIPPTGWETVVEVAAYPEEVVGTLDNSFAGHQRGPCLQ